MVFEDLLRAVGDEPVFETGLLLAGDVDRRDVERQLSRWTASGRLLKLRRGVYALAPPYAKSAPHPYLVANRLVPGSYVSLQSALAHHGLIPEHVPVTTSVTPGRPARWTTPLGTFDFRHLKRALVLGYERVPLPNGQSALIARPEKALLDLVHLEAGTDDPRALAELRLQHLDGLDVAWLRRQGRRSSPKLDRAARRIERLADAERSEYRSL
ncbi:MAG: hypothetical protein HYY06_04895 [Deltaproteobacteria bacterium]|nr:hypothetical protein [Deltaproteobacteria bacterium]